MRIRVLAALMAAAVAGACSDSVRPPTGPETISLPVQTGSAQHEGSAHNHRAHLSGEEEVFTPATPDAPTPADSLAQGQAIFHVSRDESSVSYKLIVANIENVVAAHIHRGPAGANGPVVVWLFGPAAAGGGRLDGVIAEGTFTGSDLVGPLAGQPLSALLALMRSGEAYVNVHTNDGVAPVNTGPGDFPGGEVRGQVR